MIQSLRRHNNLAWSVLVYCTVPPLHTQFACILGCSWRSLCSVLFSKPIEGTRSEKRIGARSSPHVGVCVLTFKQSHVECRSSNNGIQTLAHQLDGPVPCCFSCTVLGPTAVVILCRSTHSERGSSLRGYCYCSLVSFVLLCCAGCAVMLLGCGSSHLQHS